LSEWLAVAVVEQMPPGMNGTSVFANRALAAEGRTALADL
jgi:hypothetical protein